MNGSVSTSVVHFLADAVKDKIIPQEYLLNLIKKTKSTSKDFHGDYQPEGNVIQPENNAQNHSQQNHHPLSIAAANAITILNVSDYDFINKDLSKLNIPGANLSHGIFEGTNFDGANLEGVNFTEAWLKDTSFVNAKTNMIKFGVIPDLKIDKEAFCVAHSPDGNNIAIGVRY